MVISDAMEFGDDSNFVLIKRAFVAMRGFLWTIEKQGEATRREYSYKRVVYIHRRQ